MRRSPIPTKCLGLIVLAGVLAPGTAGAQTELNTTTALETPPPIETCPPVEVLIDLPDSRSHELQNSYTDCPSALATDYVAGASAEATYNDLGLLLVADLVGGVGEIDHTTGASGTTRNQDEFTIEAGPLNGTEGSIVFITDVVGSLSGSIARSGDIVELTTSVDYSLVMTSHGGEIETLASLSRSIAGGIDEIMESAPIPLILGLPFPIEATLRGEARVRRDPADTGTGEITGQATVDIDYARIRGVRVYDADGALLEGAAYSLVSASGYFELPTTPVQTTTWSRLKTRFGR